MPATDDVSYDKHDRTDWKQVQLKGTGVAEVTLHWDNAAADLTVDVFDSFGQQVASSPPPAGAPEKHVSFEVPTAGVYFLRVQAAKKGDTSTYTVQVDLNKGSAPPPPQQQAQAAPVDMAPPAPAQDMAATEETGANPEEAREDYDEVEGRITTQYREGSATVVHVDKGSASGITVGTKGNVLDGAAGADLLDGGELKITQVIDERRAVGKVNLKSLGKNVRVVLKVKVRKASH
jgi:hypothetical protein